MQLFNQFQWNRATLRIECSDRTFNGEDALMEEDVERGQQTWRWDAMAVTMSWSPNQVRSLTFHNYGVHDIHLRTISMEWKPMADYPYLDARNYVQLHHSQCFEKLAGVRPIHRPNDWSDPTEASSMVTVISHRLPGEALLLGAVPPYEDCLVSFPISHESAHRDGAFGISVHLASPRRIRANSAAVLANLIMLHGKNGITLLEQYAELIRNCLPPSLLSKGRVTGWNSWDYYAGAVAESDIIANTRTSREQWADSIRYIVVDEGYQSQWGIWEAGWKFPNGLPALCETIREAGFEPGIWTAPLMVNCSTFLYREHPDWYVSDKVGNPYILGTVPMLYSTSPILK
ncbi:alpha-galactosidase [Paenibacillus oryzisoli]|uniref:alpha-galactosidase n=1 Tax=Paenibacillus oryzisoli TaxID=1850517 RepID=UPI001428ABAE|nr:alpha-galactosidase [Paenibacillus oryzisoli]